MTTQIPPPNSITFLGTAGARFMVSKQLTASGGMWLNLEDTQILVDPGPGSIVQSTKRKLRAEKLDAIILSHRHLDHSADVNIMVEAMTQGGFHPHGRLFAPSDALETEPVIYSYLRKFLEGVEVLKEGGSYTVGNVGFATPIRHIHQAETYGLLFNATGHKFAYIADTRYFEGLRKAYAGSDVVIINVVLLEPKAGLDHLSVVDAARLITELKPKVAILTHYGMHVWQAKPWEIAERLTQETGITVRAAYDGMKFELAQVECNG
jgi:ribonuclease BN (tRNA processing enzyme)